MESIDKYINLIDSRFEIPSVDMKAVEERISIFKMKKNVIMHVST